MGANVLSALQERSVTVQHADVSAGSFSFLSVKVELIKSALATLSSCGCRGNHSANDVCLFCVPARRRESRTEPGL